VLAFRGAIPVLAHDAITDNLMYFFDIIFISLRCAAVESVRGSNILCIKITETRIAGRSGS
jgi:hypothetical protein